MRLSPAERTASYRQLGWWRGVTVDSLLREAVAARGESEALVDPPNREALIGSPQRRLSFDEVDAAVERFAQTFLRLGAGPAKVVLVQLPNIVEGVIAFLACARIGAILSPVPMAYRRHELGKIIESVDPALVLTVERFHDHDHRAELERLIADSGRNAPVRAIGSDSPAHGFEAEEARTRAAPPAAVTEPDPSDILTICWTSGTEADPKGVPRHHDHWVVNGEALHEAASLGPDDALLNPFPLINIAAIGGMVMPWLLAKAKLVQHHPFDLPVFLAQLQQERIAYTVAPPAVLNMLLKGGMIEGIDLAQLRCLGSGSAPLAPWMVAGWQARGIPIMNVFGSNEGCSLFSTHADMPDPDLRASYFPRFGVPGLKWNNGIAAKIRTRLVDPASEEEIVGPGRIGELRIDGAMTFDGYWNAPELNARAFDDQGYFRTGDLFRIADVPGRRFYEFVGRSKEVIIRGGINISPAELDALIESHPKVREAACAGYPDERLGERVCAVVVLSGNESLELDELNALLKGIGISTYKLPEKLRVVDALPRNPLGKVVRRALAPITAT